MQSIQTKRSVVIATTTITFVALIVIAIVVTWAVMTAPSSSSSAAGCIANTGLCDGTIFTFYSSYTANLVGVINNGFYCGFLSVESSGLGSYPVCQSGMMFSITSIINAQFFQLHYSGTSNFYQISLYPQSTEYLYICNECPNNSSGTQGQRTGNVCINSSLAEGTSASAYLFQITPTGVSTFPGGYDCYLQSGIDNSYIGVDATSTGGYATPTLVAGYQGFSDSTSYIKTLSLVPMSSLSLSEYGFTSSGAASSFQLNYAG